MDDVAAELANHARHARKVLGWLMPRAARGVAVTAAGRRRARAMQMTPGSAQLDVALASSVRTKRGQRQGLEVDGEPPVTWTRML